MLLSHKSDLEALAVRLREHGAFALDMEFQRERVYRPRLQLIQVGLPHEALAVDPLALEDLSPLFDLIADPGIQKVTHAGRQDAEIIFAQTGRPPANIYDTQVAAALVGMGEQLGYAALAHRVLGVRVQKHERVTDWERRPLTDSQLEYALDDVRYLLPLRDQLDEQLADLGRVDWLREELRFYEDVATYRPDPERLFMRVSRWRSLNRRGMAILRELATWREEEAERRDLPRQRVIPDDVLLDIAQRKPDSPEDLKTLRRLHPRELARNGEHLVAAVARGLAVAEDELPRPAQHAREDPDTALVVDLLAVLLRKRARTARVAPSYLGNQRDITDLVEWVEGGSRGEPPLLYTGWRREVAGEPLEALYRGRMRLGVDTAAGKIREEPGA